MNNCVRKDASNRGFTLLEVLLAAALLATAATSIVVVYVHSVRQATVSRDLTYATSSARNALEEGFVLPPEKPLDGDLQDRPSLHIRVEAQPAGQDLLADVITTRVTDKKDGEAVCEFQIKRAVYILPEEPQEGGADNGNTAQGGADNEKPPR